MISTEELKKYQKDCLGTIKIKTENALKGHDHIVLSHTINAFKLLELTSELLNFREKYGEYEGIKNNEQNNN